MPKSRPPYPAAFRQQMVELVRSGRTPGELAREFEPSAEAIRNWVAQADRDAGERTDGLSTEDGTVWVFPPPELADPFISKTLLELESGRVPSAALLVPMTPWSDPTRLAFGSPHFHAVVIPSSPITCRRPDGTSVCPEQPHWILLFGQMMVREGRAPTAARAIRQRYEREPVSDPDSPPDRPPVQPLPVQSPPPGEVTVPTAVLDHVRQLIGDLTFDPCSAAWCADHVGAADWCGADVDGLLRP